MEGLAAYCAAFIRMNLDGVLVLSRPKYRELLLDLLDDDAIEQHIPHKHPSRQTREPDGHKTRDAAVAAAAIVDQEAFLRHFDPSKMTVADRRRMMRGVRKKLKAIDLIEQSCKGQNGRKDDSSTIELPSSQVPVLQLADLPAEVRAKVARKPMLLAQLAALKPFLDEDINDSDNRKQTCARESEVIASAAVGKGPDYSARPVLKRNSQADRQYMCALCGVQCTNEKAWREHEAGKRHQKKVKQGATYYMPSTKITRKQEDKREQQHHEERRDEDKPTMAMGTELLQQSYSTASRSVGDRQWENAVSRPMAPKSTPLREILMREEIMKKSSQKCPPTWSRQQPNALPSYSESIPLHMRPTIGVIADNTKMNSKGAAENSSQPVASVSLADFLVDKNTKKGKKGGVLLSPQVHVKPQKAQCAWQVKRTSPKAAPTATRAETSGGKTLLAIFAEEEMQRDLASIARRRSRNNSFGSSCSPVAPFNFSKISAYLPGPASAIQPHGSRWYEPERAEMRPIAEIQRAEEEAAAEAKEVAAAIAAVEAAERAERESSADGRRREKREPRLLISKKRTQKERRSKPSGLMMSGDKNAANPLSCQRRINRHEKAKVRRNGVNN